LFFPDIATSATVITFPGNHPLRMMRPVRSERLDSYPRGFS
jgi:hypothetical protein